MLSDENHVCNFFFFQVDDKTFFFLNKSSQLNPKHCNETHLAAEIKIYVYTVSDVFNILNGL